MTQWSKIGLMLEDSVHQCFGRLGDQNISEMGLDTFISAYAAWTEVIKRLRDFSNQLLFCLQNTVAKFLPISEVEFRLHVFSVAEFVFWMYHSPTSPIQPNPLPLLAIASLSHLLPSHNDFFLFMSSSLSSEVKEELNRYPLLNCISSSSYSIFHWQVRSFCLCLFSANLLHSTWIF